MYLNNINKKQHITVGIIRCDYMLDKDKLDCKRETFLSQVEINTFGCGGCATPSELYKMHR